MLRFEEGEEKKPPANALDLPKSDELSTPTGAARFTLLNTFLPIAVKDNEYLRGALCPMKDGRPPLLLSPPGPRPPPGPPPCPPPGPPPPAGGPLPPPLDLPSTLGPIPKDLLTRKFRLT